MKKFVFVLSLVICGLICFAQQPRIENSLLRKKNAKFSKNIATPNVLKTTRAALNGNFIATDINGVEHNLQTYLDQGKTVIFNLFEYGSFPCWQLHTSGALENFYDEHVVDGTEDAVILMVETTEGCTMDLLQGGSGSQGDWTLTAGGNNQVPIIMNASCYSGVFGNVTDNYVPNVVMVCPNGQATLLNSYGSSAAIYANFGVCLDETDVPIVSIAGPTAGSIGGSVTFESNVATVADVTSYAWTIEGGTPATATTEDVTVTFATAGSYTVTLVVSNANGPSVAATHTITVLDCNSAISEFPHTEDFEDEVVPPCWTVISTNTENQPVIDELTTGDFSFLFSSYYMADDYNQYLITPELSSTKLLQFAFRYKSTQEGEIELFSVGYSTTTNDPSSFTWSDTIEAIGINAFEDYSMTCPAGTKYFAIHYFSDYMYYLAIDDIEITEITNPLITATPEILRFNLMMGDNAITSLVSVFGDNLDDQINVATAAPFSVSADNVTFTTAVTLPSNGGNLYVKYEPTELGRHAGTVVLSSTGATDVLIALNGQFFDCNVVQTLPFTEDFEAPLTDCWRILDEDGDGYTWGDLDMPGQAGDDLCYSSGSYDSNVGALTPDNWLITPKIQLGENMIFTFYRKAQNPNWLAEHYGVYISTTGTNARNFTELFVETISTPDWEMKTIDLSAYENQEVYIAWRHFDCTDNIALNIDKISIQTNTPVIIATPETLDFESILGDDAISSTVSVAGVILTDQINIATTPPFSVSTDNVTFTTTATLPSNGGNLYVKYEPTELGTHTGTVVLSSTGATDVSVSLNGQTSDCSGVETLPFTEDFEASLNECWRTLDEDGDGFGWLKMPFNGQAGNDLCYSSASYHSGALTPDNWLITPKIQLTSNLLFTFYMASQDASYPNEKYGVYVSTTGTNPCDFTELFVEIMTATGGSNGNAKTQTPWVMKTIDLSAYENQEVYIAWRHFGCTNKFFLNLDKISIIENTAINEVSTSEIAVYPNPANDMMSIANAEGQNVVVVNALGQVVTSIENATANQIINLANFANGTYFVKVNGNVIKFNVVK